MILRVKFNQGIILMAMSLYLVACGGSGLRITDDKKHKMVQRSSMTISGSEGDVDLIVGDVTGGSVKVTLQGIENEKLYFSGFVREGGAAFFKYGNQYYRVRIDGFEEHIFHDDYAFVSLRHVSEELGKTKVKAENMEKSEMTTGDMYKAISKIKASDLVFLRNGETWSGIKLSDHLGIKFQMNKLDLKTREDFVEKVVGHSIATDEAYSVIKESGDTLSLTTWLGFK